MCDFARERRMPNYDRCAVGSEHAESGDAWGSTEKRSFLQLEKGSPGVIQAVLDIPRLPPKKKRHPPIDLPLQAPRGFHGMPWLHFGGACALEFIGS